MRSFKKPDILKNKTVINNLFRNGKIIDTPFLKCIWDFEKSLENQKKLKFLISVPKKNINLATNRNRIKRQIRELLRHKKSQLTQKLEKLEKKINIAIVYKKRETYSYDVLDEKITVLLSTLIKKI